VLLAQQVRVTLARQVPLDPLEDQLARQVPLDQEEQDQLDPLEDQLAQQEILVRKEILDRQDLKVSKEYKEFKDQQDQQDRKELREILVQQERATLAQLDHKDKQGFKESKE